MGEEHTASKDSRGPSTWDPVVPKEHPANKVRKLAVRSFGLIVLLYILGVPPQLAVLRTVAGWMTAAALAVIAISLVWAVVSNQRVRHRRAE